MNVNLYQGDKDDEGEKSNISEIVRRVEDLKFEYAMLCPKENDGIYGKSELRITFKINTDHI